MDPGHVLMVGLAGPRLDPAEADWLERHRPAGVILSRNLESVEQTSALLREIARRLPGPALFAIDQEGGRVSRLAPWIGPTPTAARLSATDESTVRSFGAATGKTLAALGFNVDFAPVVDLCEANQPNGIGDRAFGADPLEVTRWAGSWLRGLQSTGVAGCLKHFPGLGETSVDSHEQLPEAGRSLEQLEALDLEPYRRLGPEAASVMVGHGYYPALDPADRRPATCSPRIVDGLLREQLGYQGLIVSDDLEMGAVANRDAEGAAAVEALRAGCDLLLYCADLQRAERAVRAIQRAVDSDPSFADRIVQACRRIDGTALRWPCGVGRPERFAELRRSFDAFSAWV